VVFAALLLVCCGASVWLQMRSNGMHEQEVIQRLSSGLAAHIAENSELMKPGGLNQDAGERPVRQADGRQPQRGGLPAGAGRPHRGAGRAARAPEARQGRAGPIRKLLAGAPLPIAGDDPRSPDARKVFSAAPLRMGGREAGYVYVVLQGEDHDALVANVAADNVLRTTLWSMGLVALLGPAGRPGAFRLITRPLRELTAAVKRFETEGIASLESEAPTLERLSQGGDEIAQLGQAFTQMTRRIAEQWRELTLQDQQRRELFANISHDLRTPLTSLHGYLETLLLKAGTLDEAERRRYLEIALGQSRKVGRLAQEVFELARLEYGVVKPEKENFALADLVQDVFQKFELAAEARHQRLKPDIAPGLPVVSADLGMIERVLTNLLDNAIRHTPAGGEITVQLRSENAGVAVQVSDTGPGIPGELQKALFMRPVFMSGARTDGASSASSGGLGLVIVKRILQLHGSDIRLVQQADKGAVFRFQLGGAGGGGRAAGADEAPAAAPSTRAQIGGEHEWRELGPGRARRLIARAVVRARRVARERAAVARRPSVRHRGRRDHVVARRLGAALLPRGHVVEGFFLLLDREVAVRDASDGALHQPVAVALGCYALVVDLFHAEGHVQVAERVQRDHRDLEFAVGLGNPAQAVGAQAVGVGHGRELLRSGVERVGGGSVAVDLVGEAVGVERALVQDAGDGAVAAEHAPHGRERAPEASGPGRTSGACRRSGSAAPMRTARPAAMSA
jgi:signal transduction histidine kinase